MFCLLAPKRRNCQVSRGQNHSLSSNSAESGLALSRLLLQGMAVSTRTGWAESERPQGRLWAVLWGPLTVHTTNFNAFQNPKRRVLPSNSSASSVAGWTLPTSSSVPSASVPWLVQKGKCPHPAVVPSPSPPLRAAPWCLASYFRPLPRSSVLSLVHPRTP